MVYCRWFASGFVALSALSTTQANVDWEDKKSPWEASENSANADPYPLDLENPSLTEKD